MTMLRPLEPADFAAAATLRCAPQVWPFLGLNRFARVAEVCASLADTRALGAYRDGTLLACVVLRVSTRDRSKHVGEIDLFCRPESVPAAAELMAHLVDTASKWLQLAKLEISCDPEAPWLSAVRSAGFEVELRRPQRRWRAGQRRLGLLLGWVRPGLAQATSASAPISPLRGPRPVVSLRTPNEGDAPAMASLHREESVMRGTLQTPMRTTATWTTMIPSTFTAMSVAAEVDGRLVGSGALIWMPTPARHTLTLGIAVSTEFQGHGVGTMLMAAMIQTGRDDLGAHRIELEVDVDNEAGRALYRKLGFVEEGVRRQGSWRGDGYCDAVAMALVFG